MLGRCGGRYAKRHLYEPNPQKNLNCDFSRVQAHSTKKRAKLLLFFT